MRENKDNEKGRGNIEEMRHLTVEVEEYRDANHQEAHSDLERGENNASRLEIPRCTKLSDFFYFGSTSRITFNLMLGVPRNVSFPLLTTTPLFFSVSLIH